MLKQGNNIAVTMCYHASTPSKKKLKEAFPKHHVDWEDHRYAPGGEYHHVSGFTRPWLPTTLNEQPGAISLSRWKLLPFWVKTEGEAAKYANTLNAESESIFEKASYKSYVGKYRGLLYVNGFYEPHKAKGVKETENYYLYLPEQKIFTLGIVYAPWEDKETGDKYNTFAIVTTAANEQLGAIHNEKKRMPLIVPPARREAWLMASDPVEIRELMRPWEGEFQAHRVARVTAMRGDTNRPEIQNKI